MTARLRAIAVEMRGQRCAVQCEPTDNPHLWIGPELGVRINERRYTGGWMVYHEPTGRPVFADTPLSHRGAHFLADRLGRLDRDWTVSDAAGFRDDPEFREAILDARRHLLADPDCLASVHDPDAADSDCGACGLCDPCLDSMAVNP